MICKKCGNSMIQNGEDWICEKCDYLLQICPQCNKLTCEVKGHDTPTGYWAYAKCTNCTYSLHKESGQNIPSYIV